MLNKCLESKNFQIKKEALEVIESLIYKYDVEFLDMVDKSNYKDFKQKIQNFLSERDKGKFDIKMINSLSHTCVDLYELNLEELYEQLNIKSLPYVNLTMSKVLSLVENRNEDFSYTVELLKLFIHIDAYEANQTVMNTLKTIIEMK